MSLLKLSRTCLIVALSCAVLPTLLLSLLISSARWDIISLPFMSSKSEGSVTDYHDDSAAFEIEHQPNTTVTIGFEHGSPEALPPELLPEPILNNNATYPRLQLRIPRSELVEAAKMHLNRLESVRHLLFDGMEQNKGMLRRLTDHLSQAEFNEEYTPPKVILTSWHWVPCAMGDCTTGEVQWIRPLVDIMKKHGIIYLFSPFEKLLEDYKLLGNDLVTHVWADDEQVVWSFSDQDRYLMSEKNPTGIPLWKLFAFTFWGSKPESIKWGSKTEPYSFNPLGPEWNLVWVVRMVDARPPSVLTPIKMPEKQFFLGYHYQGCQALKCIPFESRVDRMVVLAKRSSYYYGQGRAYDPDTFFAELKRQTGFDVISNADEEDGYPIPEGLHSIGLMQQDAYDTLLANSKALIGVGRPMISPTPYASLCRGVPVIIPYNGKIVHPHSNKTCPAQPGPEEWCGFLEDSHQHGPASLIGPPYVYTVDINSPRQDILDTVKTAINTPILPFEPPEMQIEAVEQRLLDYLSIDWRSYSEQRIAERGSDKVVLTGFLQTWARNNPDPNLSRRDARATHRRRWLGHRSSGSLFYTGN